MKEINIQKNRKQANSGLIIEPFLYSCSFPWELMTTVQQEAKSSFEKGLDIHLDNKII